MLTGIAPLLGAIAVTAALLLAAGTLKATSFLFNLFVPLPIAILTLREGMRSGLLAFAVITALLTLILPGEGIVLYLLPLIIAAYLLPLLLRQSMNWDKATAICWGTIIMAVFTMMMIESTRQGLSLGSTVNGYIAHEIGLLKELYTQSSELPAEQKDQLLTVLQEMEGTLKKIWPAVIALLAAFLLLFQVLFLSRLPSTRALVPGPDFAQWKAPEHLVWPTIIAGFSLFYPETTVQTIATNLLLVFFLIYYLQGLAVVTYFFQQRGTSPWLRALMYLMLALFNPLPFFVAGVGLFDLWVNFRVKRVKPISD